MAGLKTSGGGLKGATAGYDATTGHTSTTGVGHTSTTGAGVGGEREARTGMSDLDINKNSSATGLREKSATGDSYGRTTGTGVGSSYDTTSTTGTAGYGTTETGRTSETGHGTTGTTGDVSQGVTRSYDSTTNEIIDQERFTKTEDHEVVLEKKAYELEHRPVEKKYVVETKYMGERAVPGRATELLSTDAREVEERVVEMPRGDRTIVVENVDVPVGLESAGQAINKHSTAGHTEGQTGSTGYGEQQRTSGIGSGMGSNTGYDQQRTSGTGIGGTGIGGTSTSQRGVNDNRTL